MKIATAAVTLASSHAMHKEQSREESLRLWVGNERPFFAGEEAPDGVRVGVSPEGRQRQQVGAILLSPAATPFALKNSGNGLQGQLRETSVFLGENGGAGTVQEIDLAG